MSGHAPRPIRELAHAAREASDSQLLRLVGVLDRLPQRGAADAVLEPVRSRLKTLRPERPMTLQRLLFVPFDGLIVAPRDWRGEGRTLPRNALTPLASAILAALGEGAQTMNASLAGATLRNQALTARIGAQLWPAAALVLPETAPPGWSEAGLPDVAYVRLRPLLLLLWRHAPNLHALRVAGSDGPPDDLARPFFRALAEDGAEAVEIGLAAILPAAARPARLIALVAGMDRALAAAAERALDHFLTALSVPEAEHDLSKSAEGVQRFAALVDDLDQTTTRDKPRRTQILQGLRRAAAESCTSRLKAEVRAKLLDPIARLLSSPTERAALDDAAVERMEEQARALKALADTAYRLEQRARGANEGLREATERLKAAMSDLTDVDKGFCQADALRLIEILSGTEAAAVAQGNGAISGR